jgi:hypothetical protein
MQGPPGKPLTSSFSLRLTGWIRLTPRAGMGEPEQAPLVREAELVQIWEKNKVLVKQVRAREALTCFLAIFREYPRSKKGLVF